MMSSCFIIIPGMFTSFFHIFLLQASARGSRKLRRAAAGPSCHHGTAAAPRWQRAQHLGPGAASDASAAHGAVPHSAAGGGRVAAATRPCQGQGSGMDGKILNRPKKSKNTLGKFGKYRKDIEKQ